MGPTGTAGIVPSCMNLMNALTRVLPHYFAFLISKNTLGPKKMRPSMGCRTLSIASIMLIDSTFFNRALRKFDTDKICSTFSPAYASCVITVLGLWLTNGISSSVRFSGERISTGCVGSLAQRITCLIRLRSCR